MSGARAVKRLVDLVVGSVVLALSSPLYAIISLAVWNDIGRPVLYLQPRLGHRGRPFTLIKFRTMTEARDQAGAPLPDEQRLTAVGRFLRSTSLDELPELINVIKGDMSLVGPRPLLLEYRSLYSIDENRRHQVPPGMAGPVMAEGRNSLTWEEKFRWDLWYVDNWSLWLDAKLLAKSTCRLLSRRGATPDQGVTMEKYQGHNPLSDTEA